MLALSWSLEGNTCALTLALLGIARIMRTFVTVLIVRDGFDEQWRRMLTGVEQALLHLNPELTAAGILAAQDLILLQVPEDAQRTADALEAGSASPSDAVNPQNMALNFLSACFWCTGQYVSFSSFVQQCLGSV